LPPTATGQVRARSLAEPEDINNGLELRGPNHTNHAKDVFEMAASRCIEEETGSYTGQIRHPHNGYYAGDFSQTSRSVSELRISHAEHRDVPRAWQ
jgi:hypothetical protein